MLILDFMPYCTGRETFQYVSLLAVVSTQEAEVDDDDELQPNSNVLCSVSLTSAETLLKFMEDEDNVDFVDVLQVRGCIIKKNAQTKLPTFFKEITFFIYIILYAQFVH